MAMSVALDATLNEWTVHGLNCIAIAPTSRARTNEAHVHCPV